MNMERPIPTPDFLTAPEQEQFRFAMSLRFQAQDLRENQHNALASAQAAMESARLFTDLAGVGASHISILAEAAESHAGAALGWDRHYRETGDSNFRDEAFRQATAAINTATESHVLTAIAIPYHTRGKMYMQLATDATNRDEKTRLVRLAVEDYENSTQHPLPISHDYPLYRLELSSQLASATLHLAILERDDISIRQAAAWVESIKEEFESASTIQHIQGEAVDRGYEKAVWYSGFWLRCGRAYLAMDSEMKIDDADRLMLAQAAYDNAETIIQSRGDLQLRADDLAVLLKQINDARGLGNTTS